jgi:type II secretory pathway component GspD/PulD (secretin)
VKISGAFLALLIAVPAFGVTERTIDPQPRQVQQQSVTLDVKDEEARDVLRLMQRQCGIKNLMIDPQVQGKATFYFRDVPCRTAFDTVLATFGLKAVVYSDSLAAAEKIR